MGRFRSSGLWLAVAVCSLLGLPACGGGKAKVPLYPGKVTLIPSTTTSLELGSTLNFTAAVQTASGTNLATTITYTSSDTSIVNLAPNGVACAGHWDVGFASCTPGSFGRSLSHGQRTRGNQRAHLRFCSSPHRQRHRERYSPDWCARAGTLPLAISDHDRRGSRLQPGSRHNSIGWTVYLDCHESHRRDAHSAPNTGIDPISKTKYNFPTNQATATAVTPGITYIYATAGGATNTSFQQPTLTNASGATSPVLDFFATCAIQNIALEVGTAGSGQTNLVAAKGGTSQSIVATLTDIMGNSSLPNTDAGVVLSKIPLTWSASQPGAVGIGTGCTQSCTVSLTSPGAGTITASCSPPTCNVGFPVVPATLATPAQITACTTYFQAIYPNFAGCQLLIPTPVYSSNEFLVPPNQTTPLSPAAAISAQITGSTSTANVFASSFGCAHVLPADCSTSAYYLVTAKASAGSETAIPASPNSFLFDPAGDKLYMGSDFGAETINPTNFGSSTSPFGSLGTVTGKVLAVSSDGNSAIFSDTIHTPNQVYVAQTAPTSVTTALNISSATVAAFSPDGLKAFIVGGANSSSLYIYSPLQALQGPFPLSGPANGITFSPNGAFAFVSESAANGGSANITAFANCNNQLAGAVNLPANPILMKIIPAEPMEGVDSYGYPIPLDNPPNVYPNHYGIHLLVLDSSGFDIVTSAISSPAAGISAPRA